MGLKRKFDLHIRLTEDEKLKLQNYARENYLSLNQVIVQFINTLVKEENQND